MSAISQPLSSQEAKRILRFMIVGFSGTVIDFALLTILKTAGLPTLTANTISFLTGVMNNYYWNSRWTFSQSIDRRRFIQFLIISLIGLMMNNTLLLLFELPMNHWFGTWGFLPAKLGATVIVMFWNYLANRFWTFRKALS